MIEIKNFNEIYEKFNNIKNEYKSKNIDTLIFGYKSSLNNLNKELEDLNNAINNIKIIPIKLQNSSNEIKIENNNLKSNINPISIQISNLQVLNSNLKNKIKNNENIHEQLILNFTDDKLKDFEKNNLDIEKDLNSYKNIIEIIEKDINNIHKEIEIHKI